MPQPEPYRERAEEARVTPLPVRAISREEERDAIAEANVISVANPVALGLTAFGLATFLGGVVAAGFLPGSVGALVPIGFLFGGVAQFLAGMWAFRKNDNLSATLFSSYGAFWATLSILVAAIGVGTLTLGANLAPFMGIFFAAWTVELFYMWIVSLRHSVSMAVTTGLLTLSLALLCIGLFSGSAGILAAGGWVGIVSGLCAMYTAFANLFNSVVGQYRVPTWPLPK